jgi:hypothetical protein
MSIVTRTAISRRSATSVALAALIILPGCAITPARMALPGLLDAEPPLVFQGMGFGQKGRFSAGLYAASFSRSDTRLALFDALFERRSGKTSFVLEGPAIDGAITAECRVAERTVTISVISFNPKPMAYVCRFSNQGRTLPAHFELQEDRSGLAGMMMRQGRRGELAFDDVVLNIVSVHRLQGSGIETGTPIGYLFESEGVPVGAVELNGKPAVRFAPGADAGARRAVMVAATALGVLWDPAESALGREAG